MSDWHESKTTTARAKLVRAQAALDLGRPEEAEKEARAALAEDANLVDAHFTLALALFDLHRLDDSLAAIGAGLALDPEWEALHVLRSDALRGKGQAQEALEAAEEAARLAPDYAPAHTARGLSLDRLHRFKEARTALEQALALEPDDPGILRSLGHVLLDTDDAEAARCFRAALEIEPNDAHTLNDLGVALQNLGQHREAMLAYKSAMLIDPTLKVARQNVHSSLGRMLGVGGFGVLAVVAAKSGKAIVWALLVGLRALRNPTTALVALGLVAGAFVVWHLVRRGQAASLREREPELMALYEKLEADKKAGRL